MKKNDTKQILNRALNRSSARARRINKALGLETVYIQNHTLVRVFPDGTVKPIRKINKKSVNELKKPLEIK